ncbi:MAG: DUF86 domain-containing protein [Verrucomicrobiia bacterium]
MKNGALRALDKGVTTLRSLGTVTASQLRGDWKTRRAIERELQIAVEIVIDVCQRIISLAGQSPAATGADAVSRCVQLGVLSSVEPYRKMVQFRNFIVHHYEDVDLEILVDIVNYRLGDFERFREEVLRHVQR